MKRVAIVQSNYIPWKGYFDLIASVDEFILYDDMQYTRRDWRNRNQIKTPRGLQWLTIPIRSKGLYHQKIRDTEAEATAWGGLHWKQLVQNYRRAAHFDEIADWLAPLYLEIATENLSQINTRFLTAICSYLEIPTRITYSWNYELIDGPSERLSHLCVQAGASEYISGPAAIDYLDTIPFEQAGIKVGWFDYQGYTEYPQLWGSYAHNVSILDLLFNCGSDSAQYMKHVQRPCQR